MAKRKIPYTVRVNAQTALLKVRQFDLTDVVRINLVLNGVRSSSKQLKMLIKDYSDLDFS